MPSSCVELLHSQLLLTTLCIRYKVVILCNYMFLVANTFRWHEGCWPWPFCPRWLEPGCFTNLHRIFVEFGTRWSVVFKDLYVGLTVRFFSLCLPSNKNLACNFCSFLAHSVFMTIILAIFINFRNSFHIQIQNKEIFTSNIGKEYCNIFVILAGSF